MPYGVYRRQTYERLFPFFALLAHAFLLLSTAQPGAPSSTLMTSVYAGATASAIALSVLTGSKTAESPYLLTTLLGILIALIALAYQPSRLTLEPEDDDQPSSSSSAFTHPLLRLAFLLPYALFIFMQAINPSTFDIVVAHYDKPLPLFSDHLERVYTAPLIRQSRRRTIVYHKGNLTEDALWAGLGAVLRKGTDEVHLLPNYGREGGTYLEHLIARYDPSTPSSLNPDARPLAHHTLFLQPHMAWDWIAGTRLLYTLNPRTGFVSLSKYLTNLCGKDSEQGAVYEGFKKVFEEVEGRECREGNEEDRVLQTWSGQFVVSRERVRRNERGVYERLRDVIQVRPLLSSFFRSRVSLTLVSNRRQTRTPSTTPGPPPAPQPACASPPLFLVFCLPASLADARFARTQQPRLRPRPRTSLAAPPPLLRHLYRAQVCGRWVEGWVVSVLGLN